MFEDVKRAGILPGDFAKLARVARPTASAWFNGHAAPHALLSERVDKLLDAIRAALEAQELPLKPGHPRATRRDEIAKIVAKYLNAVASDA